MSNHKTSSFWVKDGIRIVVDTDYDKPFDEPDNSAEMVPQIKGIVVIARDNTCGDRTNPLAPVMG